MSCSPATPSRAPRPREPYHLPATLILPLSHWHKRLGNPTVTVEEDRQGSKLTGHYVITVGQLPCQTLRLTGEVYDAYERYNDALLELTETTTFPRDLGAWYGRAHDKALRVAMLLASLHGEDTINLTHWARAQNLVETWRTNLHDVLVTVSEQTPLSKEAQIEAKIERLLVQSGGMTARELQKHLYGVSGDVLQKMLSAMERLGMLYVEKIGKKNLYTIFEEEADGTS